MGKRNAALEALVGTATQMVAASASESSPPAEVVHLPAGQGAPASQPVPPPQSAARKGKAQVAKYMLYLPPKVKRKFDEIAFHDGRDGSGVKPHDHYLAALEKYLRDKGHPREADVLATSLRERGYANLLLR